MSKQASKKKKVLKAAFYVPFLLGWDLVNRFESEINLTLIQLKYNHSVNVINKEIIKTVSLLYKFPYNLLAFST